MWVLKSLKFILNHTVGLQGSVFIQSFKKYENYAHAQYFGYY